MLSAGTNTVVSGRNALDVVARDGDSTALALRLLETVVCPSFVDRRKFRRGGRFGRLGRLVVLHSRLVLVHKIGRSVSKETAPSPTTHAARNKAAPASDGRRVPKIHPASVRTTVRLQAMLVGLTCGVPICSGSPGGRRLRLLGCVGWLAGRLVAALDVSERGLARTGLR